MTLTFVSNFLNHHQLPLCQALYKALGEDFAFVSVQPLDKTQVSQSYADVNTAFPFCVARYESEDAAQRADALIEASDVVLFGAAPLALFRNRICAGKLTFRYSERVFKPDYTPCPPYTWACLVWETLRARGAQYYLLSSGAYTAHDFACAGAFRGRAYRWGYFPPVDKPMPPARTPQNEVRILWAGRLLPLKHAEYAVLLAQELQRQGIPFSLTIAGEGEMRAALEQSAAPLGARVRFTGGLSLEETRAEMQRSDVFLFTSNATEGWGAVLSEAMTEGCAVLSAHTCGAAPFLIEQGENGLLFDFDDTADLLQKGVRLCKDAALRARLGENAAHTMRALWNANVAAERLLALAAARYNHTAPPTWSSGPCSADPARSPAAVRCEIGKVSL